MLFPASYTSAIFLQAHGAFFATMFSTFISQLASYLVTKYSISRVRKATDLGGDGPHVATDIASSTG